MATQDASDCHHVEPIYDRRHLGQLAALRYNLAPKLPSGLIH